MSDSKAKLLAACLHGNLKEAQTIIDGGLDPNDALNDAGRTILHHATRVPRRIEFVNYLISEKKVDVNKKDHDGYTALHFAAYWGRDDVAQALINAQADLDVVNNNQLTPSHYAAGRGNLSVLKLLKSSGANLAFKNDWGFAPIHEAADWGQLEVLQFLVNDCKADPLEKTKNELVPLHYAARKGRLSVVKYLVSDLGCDINIGERGGYTPLHEAATSSSVETVQWMLDNGGDKGKQNNLEKKPVEYASDPDVKNLL